jgi:hypothetical protein
MKTTLHFCRVLVCLVLFTFNAFAAPENELTKKEKKDGWQLLFDGKTLNGWRCYGKSEPPGPGWSVENGTLHLSKGAQGGDIITTNQFTDYEFSWDWKLADKANNGIKYLVTESRPSAPGLEYQMVDDSTMDDKRHQTGALYFIFEPAVDKPLRPAGAWNSSKIVVRGKHVEHWLNGAKIVQYELESQEMRDAIARSKFKNLSDFDKKITGHILLTDHHDEVWYRNLKIRERK